MTSSATTAMPAPSNSLSSSVGTPTPPTVSSSPGGSLVSSQLKKPSLGLGTPLILPHGYGCVVMTGLGSMALLAWKAMKVAEARRDFKIPNPVTHSETCMTFNCVYRAMQSTVEIYPQFLFLLMTGGLEMPFFSTVGGVIWILGRYAYAKGYYSGDPRKRSNGSFYIIGKFMLITAALRFAIKRLLI